MSHHGFRTLFTSLKRNGRFLMQCQHVNFSCLPKKEIASANQLETVQLQSLVKRHMYKNAKLSSLQQHTGQTTTNHKTSGSITKTSANLESQTMSEKTKQSDSRSTSSEMDENSPRVVYIGTLTTQIKHVKLFSLTTSAMGLGLQPMLISKTAETSVGASIAVFTMVGFFTYVTPFLINFMAKKYVCQLVYDPTTESYTAQTYNFFMLPKQLTFTVEDVEIPDVPGPFTTFLVKSKEQKKKPTALFVAASSFLEPVHYGRLMGYDKPIDLHLTVADVEQAIAEKKNSKLSKSIPTDENNNVPIQKQQSKM